MRPTLGHITADALARVYAAAYGTFDRQDDMIPLIDGDEVDAREVLARRNAADAVRAFIALVEEERGVVTDG